MSNYPISGTFIPIKRPEEGKRMTVKCATCGIPLSTEDKPELHLIGFSCSATPNNQDNIRTRYPINTFKGTTQDELVEAVRSEVLAVLEQLEQANLVPGVLDVVPLSAIQTLKERYE